MGRRAASPVLTASALGLIVLLVLGGALLLTRQLRAANANAPSAAPTSAVVAQAAVTPPATVGQPAPAATPAIAQRAATPAPTTPPTTTQLEATRVSNQAQSVAASQASADRPDQNDPAVSGTPIRIAFAEGATPPAVPAGTPPPAPIWWQRTEDSPQAYAQAVEDAYIHFWNVRTQAMATLDEGLMRQVMAGPALDAELGAMRQLEAAGQIQRVEVEHHPRVLWASADQGAVDDAYLSRTVNVDANAATADQQPQVNPTLFHMAYRLQRSADGWRIVDTVSIQA